jgi:16S rRNA C967 or C1407 C5-methylase (RsmB/RsmF family)
VNAVELLDLKEEEVLVYNRCDFVVREGEKLHGYLLEKNDVEGLENLSKIVYEKILKV